MTDAAPGTPAGTSPTASAPVPPAGAEPPAAAAAPAPAPPAPPPGSVDLRSPGGRTATDPGGAPVPVGRRYPAAAVPPAPPGPFAVAWDRFWERGRPAGPALLAAVVAVGVAGGLTAVNNRPGLGLALTGIAALALAVPALVRARRRFDLVLLALAALLLASLALRDAPWLVALLLLTAGLLAAVATSAARAAWAVLLVPVTAGLAALRAVPWVTRSLGDLTGSHRARWGALARSALATVVLLAVFTALFAGADAVFAAHLPRLTLDEAFARVFVALVVAWGAATLAHLAAVPPGWSTITSRPRPPAGLVEWAVPVIALGALQAGFVGLQIATLARGHDYVLATAGVSYADYAREGFGQLLAATVLTLLVVGIAALRAPRGTATERLVTRLALGLLSVALLGVVASALRRMALYVDAFGLTRLRIVATTTEIVLGVVVLLLLVAGIRWRGAWLPRAVVVVVAGAMVGLVALDPDALILRHNLTADRALDMQYLRGLSADAAPAAADLPPELRDCVLPWLVPDEPDALAGWNLARDRAGGLGAAPTTGVVPADCW